MKSILQKLEEKRGPITGLYFLMQKHPDLLQKFSDLGGYLRFEGILPKKVKNWVTLVVAQKHAYKRVFETHLKKSPLSKELLLSLIEKKKVEEPYHSLKEFVYSVLDSNEVDPQQKEFLEQKFKPNGFLELLFVVLFYDSFIKASKTLKI